VYDLVYTDRGLLGVGGMDRINKPDLEKGVER
jgi:hypothetical protein